MFHTLRALRRLPSSDTRVPCPFQNCSLVTSSIRRPVAPFTSILIYTAFIYGSDGPATGWTKEINSQIVRAPSCDFRAEHNDRFTDVALTHCAYVCPCHKEPSGGLPSFTRRDAGNADAGAVQGNFCAVYNRKTRRQCAVQYLACVIAFAGNEY